MKHKRPKLKPCPFCGGPVHIVVSDDEGNVHGDSYEDDPWSGLSYQLSHTVEDGPDCPIATEADEQATIGSFSYPLPEYAAEAWNKRVP